MGWNTIMKPEKGLLAGVPFVGGDITGNITFSNYSANVDTIPTVSQDEQNHRIQEYIGWTPDNSFNWIVSNLDTTHKLVAAFRLTPIDITHPGAGTFLCAKMWARDIQNTESRKSAYIGCEWSKRVYTDNIAYTETYPLGNYWADTEYNFTLQPEFPNRSAETITIFLKTGYFDLVENIVGGLAIGWRNGYASCYGTGKAFRAKYSWFKSANGFGIDADFPEGDMESPEFGPAAAPGGYIGSQQGTHDKSTEHSGIPTKPQYGFTSAGFLNHYLITSRGLEQLGEAVFPEPAGLSTSVEQAIDRLVTNQWNSKLVDYIIDCRIIPVMPHDDGLHDLSVGGKVLIHPDTQAIYRAYLIDEDFVDVDCGTITTDLVEGNFLDFYNMSAKLFLPFYGFVDIAPEYWMGATLGVHYRFNMMDGSFMVWITSKAFGTNMNTDDVIAQYAGNACIHLPINTQAYGNIISGMITTGAAIVGAAATGGPLGVAGAMASGAANIINSRPQLNANNSYNGSAALMSKRTPYLLIEFNNAQFSTKYTEEQGLPLVVTRTLGTLSGMTVCMDPIINFACADDEAAEIQGLLKSGVIL